MNTIKLFDYYTEFPFDDELLSQQINSSWLTQNIGFIVNSKDKQVVSKEAIIENYERFKREGFYFSISKEYKSFFFELGIEEIDSFLFPNPLFDTSFLEFELFFAAEHIGEEIYIINNTELNRITDKFDHVSLKEYIKTMEVSIEYLLTRTIDMNNYAFEEYKEGYLSNFNELAQQRLDQLKDT